MNANYLRFDKTGHLDLLLFQPGIRKKIGVDLGAGFLYRPLLNENVVITAGVTGLIPGSGFEDIFTSTCATGVCGVGEQEAVERVRGHQADLLTEGAGWRRD